MSAQKSTLTIVVNGVSTEVERNDNAPLRSAIEQALADTGNVGQPIGNWELRDSDGNMLDQSATIGSFAFPDDVKLFLSLKAGIGG